MIWIKTIGDTPGIIRANCITSYDFIYHHETEKKNSENPIALRAAGKHEIAVIAICPSGTDDAIKERFLAYLVSILPDHPPGTILDVQAILDAFLGSRL